jgi:hypothetical protein
MVDRRLTVTEDSMQDMLSTGDRDQIRGKVINLSTLDQISFFDEPAEYSGSVAASYTEEASIGMSHAHLGFRNTGNERMP